MKISTKKMRKAICAAGVLFLISMPQALFAGEARAQDNASAITNIGFMKNPPKKLKEKFPMCDQFLNVKWIDKEKKLGYAHYEAILKGKRAKFDGERRKVWALVDMNVPNFMGDLYKYKSQGQLNALFEKIRKGKYRFGSIEYKGKTIMFYDAPVQNDDEHYALLSDHRQTVCIPYPDGKRMWIAERKSVKHAYSEMQIEELAKRINADLNMHLDGESLGKYQVLDITADGVSDFIHENFFIYSSGGRYYNNNVPRKIDVLKSTTTFAFPPLNRTCLIHSTAPLLYFTTDGERYYLNNICDLSELTSASKE